MIRTTSSQPAWRWPLQAAILLAIPLAGCQSSSSAHWADAPGRSAIADRSLATDSIAQQAAAVQNPMHPITAAWLDTRNDRRKATAYGRETTNLQQTITYRYDRQITANGRTYDYGHTTTYQVTVTTP